MTFLLSREAPGAPDTLTDPHPHPQPTMPWVSYRVGQPHTGVS